jgi:hypothetical protein
MVTEFEKGDPRLFVKEGDRFEYDVMPDDQAMVFTTTKGMVVFLGCAHAGMVNTLYHIQNMLGSDQFYAILGDAPRFSYRGTAVEVHRGAQTVGYFVYRRVPLYRYQGRTEIVRRVWRKVFICIGWKCV